MAPTDNTSHCMEHSGLTTKLNGGLALLLGIFGMLGFQTFVQVPQLKYEVNQEITIMKGQIAVLQSDVQELKRQKGTR